MNGEYDYLKACLIEGANGTAEKICKSEFARFAKENGLYFCGTLSNKTMPFVMLCCDEAIEGGFQTREERDNPDKVEGTTSSNLYRHTKDGKKSRLDLSGGHCTVCKYRGFYFIHNATFADNRCSFDAILTICYC